MRQGLKLALFFALALFAVPFAASAHPAFSGSALADKAAAPIVKTHCYYEGCEEEVIIRRRCRYGGCGYRDDWRRDCEAYGCYHNRYQSHYRWGSYHRLWRPWWCCRDSGWGD